MGFAGILGYALTLAGVFLYSEAKRRTKPSQPGHKCPELESKSSGLADMLNGDATVMVSVSPRNTPRKVEGAPQNATFWKEMVLRHTQHQGAEAREGGHASAAP